jgi:integrase
MSHAEAVKAALTFCEHCDREWNDGTAGALDPKIDTVEAVCRAYLENLRAEKGPHAGYDATQKLKMTVYGKEIGRIRRRELAPIHIQRWRNRLVTPQRQRQSANRIYRALVAALNWGYRLGYFETDRPWTSVGPFPVSDGQRDGYLSDIQRSSLIVACDANKTPEDLEKDPHLRYCTPDLGNLLRGYFYTGTRPGELAKVRVEALNRREKSLTVTSAKNKMGEARPRVFYLYESAAFAFFEKMAADKPPGAHLMTKSDGSGWMYDNTGRPRYRDWGRGIKAAIRRANQTLTEDERISEDIVAYSVRHDVITDLLSEDGIDQGSVEKITGTSGEMIRRHYYKVVEERLKKKLVKRRSLGNTEVES